MAVVKYVMRYLLPILVCGVLGGVVHADLVPSEEKSEDGAEEKSELEPEVADGDQSPSPNTGTPVATTPPKPETKPVPAGGNQAPPDTATAPKPGKASGITVSGERTSDNVLRWIPRTVFFVPRVASEVLVAPLRGTLWLYDRYQLKNRFETLFFNDDGTFGVFPVALVETGFGINIGARVIFRDLFGEKEGLRFRISYGGRFKQIYTFSLSSGNRFGATKIKVAGEYAIQDGDKFFGVGNSNTVDSVDTPIDVFDRGSGVSTEFQQKVLAITLSAKRPILEKLSLQLSTTLQRRQFDRELDDEDITDVYQESSLIGFSTGVRDLNTTLELSYDTRRRVSRYQAKPAWGKGLFAGVHFGYTWNIGGESQNYFRYGTDFQYIIDLYRGTRVLALRALTEGVTGGSNDIAFTDFPSLGGPLLLRGYNQDRFRDRVSVLGTAEYQWHLQKTIYGYLFVDSGRVFQSWAAAELDGFRVGYGGGIQFTTKSVFIARAQLATSVHGGLFFNLSFDPSYQARARSEQR